ncbi:hypothetical protein D1007_48891 [Hordeum vulgare]|nr:hypothetical protein D1007_48891 [Hordeum vulgare]
MHVWILVLPFFGLGYGDGVYYAEVLGENKEEETILSPDHHLNIPCTITNSLKHVAGRSFNFKAHGHRYVLDVYKGHGTTVMGGNDRMKFVTNFNLGTGALVVFDTSKRTAEAYVAHLGFAHLLNDGDPDEDIVADEDEVGEGGGVEVFDIESDENDEHEEADA